MTPGAAERRRHAGSSPSTLDLLEQLDRGPRPVRDLAGPDGRAGLLRRLRGLADGGVSLARVGAHRRRGRAPLRALDPDRRGRPRRRREPGERGAAGRSPARATPGRRARRAGAGARRGAAVGRARRAARHGGARGARPARSGRGRGPRTAPAPAGGATGRAARRPAAFERAPAGPGRGRRPDQPSHRDPRPAAAPARRGDRRGQDRDLRRGHRGEPSRRADRRSSSCRRSPSRCRSSIGCGAISTSGSRWSIRVWATASGPTSGAGSAPATSTSSSAPGWPSLAPLADVGLVIVDEEHDAAYKSDRTPRLQARDTAIQLAALAGAALVLGSATPAVDSVGRARAGRVRPDRAPGPAGRGAARGRGRRPARGARRRAARPAVSSAGGGPRRPRHGRRRAGDPRPQPARHGLGRAVSRLRARPGLPGLRATARLPPGRHDAALPPLRPRHPGRLALPGLRLAPDPLSRRRHGTARARGPRRRSPGFASAAWTATSWSTVAPPSASSTPSPTGGSTSWSGTSLVAKGLDIPSVTLVGVVSSDIALNLPDERAAERTYQLLVQAIGRAGRGDPPGPGDHPDLSAGPRRRSRPRRSGERTAFYDAELELARAVRFAAVRPPRQADRGARRPGGRRAGGDGDGPAPARPIGRARFGVTRSSGRHRPTSRGGPIAGAGTWSSAGADPVGVARWRARRALVRRRRPRIAPVIGPHRPDDRRARFVRRWRATNEERDDDRARDRTRRRPTSRRRTRPSPGPTSVAAGRREEPGATTATSILDSVREVVDDLAERAAPTVRELSARAAELTAIAADKAAPFAKRAGEVTADASGKLAAKSREWASELRAVGHGRAGDGHRRTRTDRGFEPAEGARDASDQPGHTGESRGRPDEGLRAGRRYTPRDMSVRPIVLLGDPGCASRASRSTASGSTCTGCSTTSPTPCATRRASGWPRRSSARRCRPASSRSRTSCTSW